jgi:hypothetical protein
MIQAKYRFDLPWIEGKIGQDIEVVIFSVRETKKDSDGNETHTHVEKVHVTIRDLSKRFDNECLTFNARRRDVRFSADDRPYRQRCRCLLQLAQILK